MRVPARRVDIDELEPVHKARLMAGPLLGIRATVYHDGRRKHSLTVYPNQWIVDGEDLTAELLEHGWVDIDHRR